MSFWKTPKLIAKTYLRPRWLRLFAKKWLWMPKGGAIRVNHAVRITRAGVQYTFWASMALHPTMPPPSLPLKIKTETLPRLGNPCGN
jgi:hypothetical protein